MLVYILAGILGVWLIYKRNIQKIVVKEYPLGLPKGSVRAIIALLIVAFPFNYLLWPTDIPGTIANAIFVVVAFYLGNRMKTRTSKEILAGIRDPAKDKIDSNLEPLYWPRYTVRFSLVSLIILFAIFSSLGPNVQLISTSTSRDLILTVVFFFFGFLVHLGSNARLKQQLAKKVQAGNTDEEILAEIRPQKIDKETPFQRFLAVFTLCTTITSLIMFIIAWDYPITLLFGIQLSLRETLLLFINAYYGFRT